jgi:hypothetical protein
MYCGTAYYIFKLHIRTHIYVDAHIHIVQLRMQTHKNTHKYTPKVYAQTYMRADSGGGQAQCYYQLCGEGHAAIEKAIRGKAWHLCLYVSVCVHMYIYS